MNKVVIELKDVVKTYNPSQENEVKALRGINLKVHAKDFLAIIGPSGCGKTTLLNMLGCLDRPTSGKVFVDGKDTSKLSDENLARIRRDKIGFVFQQFNLIPTLTAVENVEIPMRLNGIGKKDARKSAEEFLKTVDLEERGNHLPNQLSGGEMQRVAIARAMVKRPEVILADEPTGNLDTKTGQEIVNFMKKLSREDYTFVIVTHDPLIANFADKKIYIKDGKIIK